MGWVEKVDEMAGQEGEEEKVVVQVRVEQRAVMVVRGEGEETAVIPEGMEVEMVAEVGGEGGLEAGAKVTGVMEVMEEEEKAAMEERVVERLTELLNRRNHPHSLPALMHHYMITRTYFFDFYRAERMIIR